MGPLERDKPWNTQAIEGVYRFLQRAWRLFKEDQSDAFIVKEIKASEEDLKMTHKTIKKVTEDIEHLRFNTAISQMMVFVNHFTKVASEQKATPKECMTPFIQLLHPFAPHIAEELWGMAQQEFKSSWGELAHGKWPEFNPNMVSEDLLTLAVQVLGKTRGTIEVPLDASQAHCEQEAKKLASVAAQLDGKTIKKVIYVKGKILNFVV
jgi:leucyl-tRNA synthetase